MRAGGRLQAAIDILQEMEQRGTSAAATLREWGRAHRFAGSSDRAAIGNHLHDALRRRRSAAARLGADTARAAVLGATLLETGLDPDALELLFADDRFAPEPFSPDERNAWEKLDARTMSDAVTGDIPDWCMAEFTAAFGPDRVTEARALATRPPLDLRVNRLRATRQDMLAELADLSASATPHSPDGIRLPPIRGNGRHPNIETLPIYLDGQIEIQDEGSQLVALLAIHDGGAQVLDFCAGGGGKTLAMAACMGNRGQIHAFDADTRRLAPIHARLQRAGCRNVQIVADPAGLEPLQGHMDLVLVDAPCTGSGTWRRHPDTKWRLDPENLAQRMTEQDTILLDAARFVRPGGRLAYATCSVFPAENEQRIDAFLARSPAFRSIDPAGAWQAEFPGRQAEVHQRHNGLALTPARSGTDGFFIAAMVRTGD